MSRECGIRILQETLRAVPARHDCLNKTQSITDNQEKQVKIQPNKLETRVNNIHDQIKTTFENWRRS